MSKVIHTTYSKCLTGKTSAAFVEGFDTGRNLVCSVRNHWQEIRNQALKSSTP